MRRGRFVAARTKRHPRRNHQPPPSGGRLRRRIRVGVHPPGLADLKRSNVLSVVRQPVFFFHVADLEAVRPSRDEQRLHIGSPRSFAGREKHRDRNAIAVAVRRFRCRGRGSDRGGSGPLLQGPVGPNSERSGRRPWLPARYQSPPNARRRRSKNPPSDSGSRPPPISATSSISRRCSLESFLGTTTRRWTKRSPRRRPLT